MVDRCVECGCELERGDDVMLCSGCGSGFYCGDCFDAHAEDCEKRRGMS